MTPSDPSGPGAEALAELEAIEATLAGEPVEPRHAALAELALLVAAERPRPSSAFVAELDARVQQRFAPAHGPARSDGPRIARARGWLGWRTIVPALGALAGVAVALVIVLGSSGRSTSQEFAATPAHRASSAATAAASSTRAAITPAPSGLQLPPNGRKVIASAQLALTAPPSHIDDVAQEVFDVIAGQGGVVESSTVTAAPNASGYAQFRLSVPSSALPETMSALSRLHWAAVASRTDQSQDVNDAYGADVRRLADARALRTALLRQLAGATTPAQVTSLTAQIHDAEASIASDTAALRGLQHRVSFSSVAVTVNGVPPVVSPSGAGGNGPGGFSLGRAAHDAGRVLTVAAGVALIALAALVPLGVLAAVAGSAVVLARRRARERALDPK